MVANVNLDLSLFRPKTPGEDPSPLSRRGVSNSLVCDNDQDLVQVTKETDSGKVDQEQAARFSFLPSSREDQYRSIASKDGQSRDSLLPVFATNQIPADITPGPSANLREDKPYEKVVSRLELPQKAPNNRYRSSDSAIPDRKMTFEASLIPDVFTLESPSKIDTEQERTSPRTRSPQPDNQGVCSPNTHSLRGHTHESEDLNPKCYPAEKACDPKPDSARGSHKASSQRESPLKSNQQGPNVESQGHASSIVAEQKTPVQNKENCEKARPEGKETGEQSKISITDIFRKSLSLVQSRVENGSDDGNFDLKAFSTVYSRYENCSDSRTYQRFHTKSSCKPTENSPERQSLTPPKIVIQRFDPQKELERGPISEFVAEASSREDSEPDLGTRIETCLAQTRANIQMIEKMDRGSKDTQLTGTKRQRPADPKAVTEANKVQKGSGSDSHIKKHEINLQGLADPKRMFTADSTRDMKAGSSRTMMSARSSTSGTSGGERKEGVEESRGAFTFREQRGTEGAIEQYLDEIVKQAGTKKGVQDLKRSNSLCKRSGKMGMPQVKTIALFSQEESCEGMSLKNKEGNAQEKSGVTGNNVGNEAKRRK